MTSTRIETAALILRACTLASLVACGTACERSGLDVPSGPLLPSQIVHDTRQLNDPARATSATAAFSEASSRRVATSLWFGVEPPVGQPACDRQGRCSLILLAHGLWGRSDRLSTLGQSLAEAGYIVAAPTFPLTGDPVLTGLPPAIDDVKSQPGDVTFVIKALRRASRTEGDPLFGRIAPGAVGLVGHSLGGTTAIAASRLDCCRDTRVGAVVLIAPSVDDVGRFEEPIASRGPPTLLLHGSDDTLVPPKESKRLYSAIAPPRYLVEIDGADHVNLIEDSGRDLPYLGASVHAVRAFFDAYLGHRRRGLRKTLDRIQELGHETQSHEG